MSGIFKWIAAVNDKVNGVVWGPPMLALLLFAGIYFTVRTGFFQVTHFGYVMKKTILAIFRDKKVVKTEDKSNISQFQALATALAATIGTGNIVGVATAIAAGGAGAVFWMWFSAFFGMMTNYAENVLGIFYRKKNQKGEYIGGPMIYIEKGLGWKWLSVIFSIFCLVASFGIGNIAQINGISTSIQNTFHTSGHAFEGMFVSLGLSAEKAAEVAAMVPGFIIGVLIAIVVGVVILGGIKRIASVTEKLVPFMAAFYIIGSLIVIICNAKHIPAAFGEIFSQAFSFKSAGAGVMGYVIAQAIRYGVARGVFSNEAGLGSSVMVHSNSDVKEPVVQGIWGIFEVFFDTIAVCTVTALAILTTGAHRQGLEGVNITTYAFQSVLGPVGGYIITFGILLFAFSTILGWSIYGTRAVQYLFKDSPLAVRIYKIIFTLVIIVGAVSSVQLVWDLSDTFNGLMALPNLIGILLLSPVVIKITKNYTDRHFHGHDITPLHSHHQDDPDYQG